MDTAHAREAVIQTLLGKPCWYVSCGGSAGPTFELALGEKVPREHVLGNRAHSEEFRRFEGEVNLLVWCTWRLEAADRPLSSSDDTDAGIKRELTRIVGSVVEHVTVDLPGWDLTLAFSNGLALRVFCDHVPGDPSFDGNWELYGPQIDVSIGVGSTCEIARPDC